jgi:hypothetical protein
MTDPIRAARYGAFDHFPGIRKMVIAFLNGIN